jgi:hypothetical protein
MEHSKLIGPTASVALNENVGVRSLVSPFGPPVTLATGEVESST